MTTRDSQCPTCGTHLRHMHAGLNVPGCGVCAAEYSKEDTMHTPTRTPPCAHPSWKYYSGCLGYESSVCTECGIDWNDKEDAMKQTTRTPHTPGPWKVVRMKKNAYIESEAGAFVCDMQAEECDVNDVIRMQGDAALIAAAPEMYELLMAAYCQVDVGSELERRIKALIDGLKGR